MSIAGSRVVVTGASRGIGAVIAKKLAARGAELVLVARSAEDLQKIAAEIGGAEIFVADLADSADIARLVESIETAGPIDVVVNNAGVDLTGRLVRTDPAHIAMLIGINLTAPILMARSVLPAMIKRGSGHIVNVSSLSGTNALPGVGPYSASKAGLSHFGAALRAELRGTGVTTTLVQIGPVESEMINNLRRHGPTRRALHRLRKLGLTYDLPIDLVAERVANAIEKQRRHVRLPLRSAIFPIITEVPRRITEWLLFGVDHQKD